jgi:DNA-directed RNA polymerase specialized sigma24 family protein
MTWSRKLRTNEDRGDYAAVEDFRKLFTEEADNLYLLALLLTADGAQAEQTFVAGLEDSINSNKVFREWAHSWAKGTIIKNAIATVRPHPNGAECSPEMSSSAKKEFPTIAGMHAEIVCVLALKDFERFIFVLSVLEGYSEKKCALLLDCSLVDVHEARIRALQQVAAGRTSPLMAHRSQELIPTVIEDINEKTN